MPLSPRTLRTAEERARVADHPGLGGGNAWRIARQTSRVPDLPVVVADRPLTNAEGRQQAEFSLTQLDDLTQAWSAWYLDRGVGPHDRVVVYIEDSLEDQVQLTALAQIGAIPVLINGRMLPELALGLMRRTDPVGLYTDTARAALLAGRQDELAGLRWTCTRQDAGVLAGGTLPDARRYPHSADDAVVICHSSGTTGNPKPVIWSHRQSVAGACFRLRTHPEAGHSVMLSATPHSHTSAVAFTYYSLLAGLPLVAVDQQTGPQVARHIAAYRPTRVLAFNQTFADLATSDLDPADFSTVEEWMNLGDSAHEAHMRPLMELGRHDVDGTMVPGSVFGDGLGSSELGWAALRRVTTSDDPPSPRSLGRRVPIAEVAVLREDGTEADAGEPGMLGVRSPSVARGYWNDSDTTYRSMLAGYWLSGDLVYRDADDEFFQIDRVVDVIRGPKGDGHSILMEELLLLGLPGIEDCAVVAGRDGEEAVPVAVVRPAGAGADPADLLRRANEVLARGGEPPLAVLDLAADPADIPVGATGKTLKRHLREKYADLRGYLAGRSVVQTAAVPPLAAGTPTEADPAARS